MPLSDQYRVAPGTRVNLADWKTDDAEGVDRSEAEKRLSENILAMTHLQHTLYAERKQSLLVVLQAMDAGGKDSTIRHVFGPLNPQGVRVESFGRPTPDELARDFLWRIHQHTPRKGHVQVFNRSHYEDVLIVRVNGLVDRSVWSERYAIINEFERTLSQAGTTIVKIFLHLSKQTQRDKLAERLEQPHKRWKFEPEDFSSRAKWDEYMEAYGDALGRCSTSYAPWHIVPTDRKWNRLLIVSEIVRAALERMDPQFPEPAVDHDEAVRLLDQIP
ncbi:MAG: polyphosphate kinase 2 family protein [Phycisphaerales bacterium]|nr:polyphosphate kinase 2 family protein [Planctomycetota bacterium]MCH8509334.1 polyphosphate kinase 2 family protein [Phycisphaerales bacterium]